MDRLDPDTDYAYDPENEDAPEEAGVTCSVCGHFVPDDDPDQDAWADNGAWICSDCYDEPDPFDDVAFDGGRE